MEETAVSEIDETKLSKQSRDVLTLLRHEMSEGRLSKSELDFVQSAVKIKDSLGILGNFVVKLASFLVALGLVWTWWPKK